MSNASTEPNVNYGNQSESLHAVAQQKRKPVTLTTLMEMKKKGEKISMLTCYDASFAALLDSCGVDCLLIGDSLGNVIQGKRTTLPVTIEHMVYHTSSVARGIIRHRKF